jgi:hypothetical protein
MPDERILFEKRMLPQLNTSEREPREGRALFIINVSGRDCGKEEGFLRQAAAALFQNHAW